jgi:hypothetical protein
VTRRDLVRHAGIGPAAFLRLARKLWLQALMAADVAADNVADRYERTTDRRMATATGTGRPGSGQCLGRFARQLRRDAGRRAECLDVIMTRAAWKDCPPIGRT